MNIQFCYYAQYDINCIQIIAKNLVPALENQYETPGNFHQHQSGKREESLCCSQILNAAGWILNMKWVTAKCFQQLVNLWNKSCLESIVVGVSVIVGRLQGKA